MKSKCRKCGRFLKNSDLLYSDYNIHAKCRLGELWDQLSAVTNQGVEDARASLTNEVPRWRIESSPPGGPVFISHFVRPNPVKDFKTGDVWDHKASEKEAVRNALMKQEAEYEAKIRDIQKHDRTTALIVFVIAFSLAIVANGLIEGWR